MILPNGFSNRQIAESISPRIQELILLPTEKCNFRCTYCYEDFELGKMSESTQRSIELFLENRIPSLNQLKFAWFGGEPLLAKDVVLRLSKFAKELCDINKVHFTGGLTTNAYLLDSDLATSLIESNQNFFQITLDGWGDMHDRLRKRADGSGTFEVIWKNLLSLHNLRLNFKCNVRIHVRRDNFESIRFLIDQFVTDFEGDSRFYFDFQHLRDMGGSGGLTVENPLTQSEIELVSSEFEEYYREKLATKRKQLFGESEIISLQQKKMPPSKFKGESSGSRESDLSNGDQPYICYAGKANSLLIRSNGRLGKCTVALNDERNDIGKINSDGTLQIFPTKFSPWIRGLGNLSEIDNGCPIKNMPEVTNLGSNKIIPIKQVEVNL